MGQSKTDNGSDHPRQQAALLVGGDIMALLIFIGIGRRNHALGVTDIGADLMAVAPFVMSWFLVTPWFGLFGAEVSQNWRKLVPRLLLAWAIGGPLALVLRALFLDRTIPGGIIPSFAVVALTVTTILLLGWRLGYIWWVSRQTGWSSDTESRRL